jgi:hypothetical protein
MVLEEDMEGMQQESGLWLPFIHAANHCTMLMPLATLLLAL